MTETTSLTTVAPMPRAMATAEAIAATSSSSNNSPTVTPTAPRAPTTMAAASKTLVDSEGGFDNSSRNVPDISNVDSRDSETPDPDEDTLSHNDHHQQQSQSSQPQRPSSRVEVVSVVQAGGSHCNRSSSSENISASSTNLAVHPASPKSTGTGLPTPKCSIPLGASEDDLASKAAEPAGPRPNAGAASAAKRMIASIDPVDGEAEATTTTAATARDRKQDVAAGAAAAAPLQQSLRNGSGSGSNAQRDTAPRLCPPACIDAGLDDFEPISLGGKGLLSAGSRSNSGALAGSRGSHAGGIAPGLVPSATAVVSGGERDREGSVPRQHYPGTVNNKGLPLPVSAGGVPSTRSGAYLGKSAGSSTRGGGAGAYAPAWSMQLPPSSQSLGVAGGPYYAPGAMDGVGYDQSEALASQMLMDAGELPVPMAPTPISAAAGSVATSGSFPFSTLDPTASPWTPPWLENAANGTTTPSNNSGGTTTAVVGNAPAARVSPAAVDGGSSFGSGTGVSGQASLSAPRQQNQRPQLLCPDDVNSNGAVAPRAPSSAGTSSLPARPRAAYYPAGGLSGITPFNGRSADDVGAARTGGSPPRAPAALTICHRHNPYTGTIDYVESPGLVSRASGGIAGPNGSFQSFSSEVNSPPGSATHRAALLHGGNYEGNDSSGNVAGLAYSPNSTLSSSYHHYRDPLQRISEKRREQGKKTVPLLHAFSATGSHTSDSPASLSLNQSKTDSVAATATTTTTTTVPEKPLSYIDAIRRSKQCEQQPAPAEAATKAGSPTVGKKM